MKHASDFKVLQKIWFQNVFPIDWNTVLRPSRVFRRVLPPAKRPRIEALKLQMCVMVISPLFAVILMTDLIPVFKRPTETQHRLDIGKHFVKLWINVSINFSATSTVSLIILITNSRPTGVGACTNFEVQIFPEWVFNQLLSFERRCLKYWEIKSGFCGAKTFTKSKWWISKQLF